MEGAVAPCPAILALKHIYNFTLMVDDAHGFMSMGHGGRGAFEYWQDKGYDCPLSEIDIFTATLSKSVGCTGGYVVANGIYAAQLQRQEVLLQQGRRETLASVALLRTLALIRKRLLVEDRMRQLKEKSLYVTERLSEAGCHILSTPGSSIICFPVGKFTTEAEHHFRRTNWCRNCTPSLKIPRRGFEVRLCRCLWSAPRHPSMVNSLQSIISVSGMADSFQGLSYASVHFLNHNLEGCS